MDHEFINDIAFTPSVKAEQEKHGSRTGNQRMAENGGWADTVNGDLAGFIAERDSFYLATSNVDGRPYIQHRGGPKGFLKVVDDKHLAFADFGGNRQYITLGNLRDNPRAFIFLMDYAHQRRIKIWGRARVVDDDPAILNYLADPAYAGKPERVIVFTVDAWDVNCPQHITKRHAEADLEGPIRELHTRIAALEAENAALKTALGGTAE